MRNYKVPPIPDSIWRNPLHFIAFGFGTGALPYAPGTFGTIIAIPFFLVLRSFSIELYIGILLILIIASMWLCEKVSKDIGVADHQGMCVDEIIGYLVTMTFAPATFKWILIGFLLFRLFDIWKPWPIRQVDQRFHGGVGVILDDVLAGIYSMIILYILQLVTR
jgi:phosphatidylglycerophosphatase A